MGSLKHSTNSDEVQGPPSVWTHHSYPPKSRDAFADSREVVEHRAAPVPFSESLDFLNLF